MENSFHIFNNVFLAIVEVDAIKQDIPQKATEVTRASLKRTTEIEGVKSLMNKYLPNKTLGYNRNGKPFIQEGGYISISHSKSLIGLAWSSELNIGLDIEEITQKIEKIENRFLHPAEKKIAINQKVKTIIWCIKESMVKILDNKSINFKENLLVMTGTSAHEWKCVVLDQIENKNHSIYIFTTLEIKNNIVCIHTKTELNK